MTAPFWFDKVLYRNCSIEPKSVCCYDNLEGREMVMLTKSVTVNNQVGLHARPATFFIQKANEYKSRIWIEREERKVNAKSLLGVLSLSVVKGGEITIIADGEDEKEAIAGLAALIEANFGEENGG